MANLYTHLYMLIFASLMWSVTNRVFISLCYYGSRRFLTSFGM